MRIRRDRDLPVPIPTQLQGQIECGVGTGDLPPGSRLASVRELSTRLGISPVTVTTVYRALRSKGLIESRPRPRRSTPSPAHPSALRATTS